MRSFAHKIIMSLCVAAIATFSAWALADPTRGPVKGAVGYSGGAVAAPVMLPDGSVSAPALTFTADTDIGIYRIGADIIGIAVNGALNATFDVVGLDLVGNLELTGGGSVVTTSDGDIVLAPNGSGVVDVQNAAVYVGDGTYSWDHSPTGFATEGSIEVDGLCSLDGGANFYDTNILNPSVLYQEAATSDVAADHIATEAGNAYYKATVNTDGADNIKCGGISVKSMAVVQIGSDTSTITITTTDAEGTYTSTTLTLVSGAPGANEIQCITSDAVCSAAIVTYLASNVTHVTAEAVAAQVYLIPAATLCAMGLASADGGGTKFVLTNGVDGVVRIPFTERLALDGDLDTYIVSTSDDTIGFYTSGILQFQMTTTNFHILDNYITGTAGTRINFPADNQTRFCNALQTQCFVLAATAADTATLFDGAGTGVAVLNMQDGGRIYFDGLANSINSLANILNFHGQEGFVARMELDNSTNGGAMFLFDTHPNAEMTADGDGEIQHGILLESEVNQDSGHSVGFSTFSIRETNTQNGTGVSYFANWDNSSDGLSPEFTVTHDGAMTLEGASATVDVLDGSGDGAYWREFHVPASKVEPAAAGATPTVINTATFVYLLNANTEYLYFGTDIHDDWDAASDVVVHVTVMLSGIETANDIINAEIVAEYVGEHEDADTGIKTQTRTINHDIVSDSGQGATHHLTFVLDHDLVSHVIEIYDDLSLRFRLDVAGGAGQVAAVWFKSANIKYRTSKPQLETGGTFPSEG